MTSTGLLLYHGEIKTLDAKIKWIDKSPRKVLWNIGGGGHIKGKGNLFMLNWVWMNAGLPK